MNNVIDFATRQRVQLALSRTSGEHEDCSEMVSSNKPMIAFVAPEVFDQITDEQLEVLRSARSWPRLNMTDHAKRLGRPYHEVRPDIDFLVRAGLMDRDPKRGPRGSRPRTNVDVICTICPRCSSLHHHKI